MSSLLIHATGFAALAFNISGLIRTSDRSLRSSNGWASALWGVNNLLMGAHNAAALSAVSVGRQASASVVQGRDERTRLLTCLAFVAVTLAVCALTWTGLPTLLTTSGSLLATYAMFYMRGARLRWAMLAVAFLWMYNAWAFGSYWQILGNLLSGGAAAYGAWRATRLAEEAAPAVATPAPAINRPA